MLDILDFVRGSVADKDLVPVLTHLHVSDGTVQGGNGRMAITGYAPDLAGYDFTVPADPFYRAVVACDGTPKLALKGSALTVSKGKFRVRLPVLPGDEYPVVTRDGIKGKGYSGACLLHALQRVRPFVSKDASRVWSSGVLLADGMAWATDNVTMVGTPVKGLPKATRCIIPLDAVDELVRVGYEIDRFWITDNSAVFVYADNCWMRTALIDDKWPIEPRALLVDQPCDPVPDGLADAVRKVLPFCPDSKFPAVKFSENGVSTMDGDMAASVGGVALPAGAWRAEPLLNMLAVATHVALEYHPEPCPFKGDGGLVGVIVGLRL